MPVFNVGRVPLAHAQRFYQVFGCDVLQAHEHNLSPKSSKHAAGPFMASAFRVRQFVRENSLVTRPYVSLWLEKTYVLPAGMYAGQVWGTDFIEEDTFFTVTRDFQVRHMRFLKGTLGIKRTITNWAVLRECGHEPPQFY